MKFMILKKKCKKKNYIIHGFKEPFYKVGALLPHVLPFHCVCVREGRGVFIFDVLV